MNLLKMRLHLVYSLFCLMHFMTTKAVLSKYTTEDENINQETFVNCRDIEIISNRSLKCFFVGQSVYNYGKLAGVVCFHIQLSSLKSALYDSGSLEKPTSEKLWNLTIDSISMVVASKSEVSKTSSKTSMDFTFPPVFAHYFSTIQRLTLTLNYGVKEVDGNVTLPVNCDPERLDTPLCRSAFTKVLIVKVPLPHHASKIISLQDFILTNRMPRIKKLKYNSPDMFISLQLINEYLIEVEEIEISSRSYNYYKLGLDDIFNFNLPELKILNVKCSHLFSITKDTLAHLCNVEKLILSENDLKYVPQGIGLLKNLSFLDLRLQSNPGFKKGEQFDLNPLELSELKSLNSLGAKNLRINKLTKSTLPSSLSLQYLDFSYCNIKVIEENCFENLPLLKIILLNNNMIQNIFPNTFSYLKTSTEINLRSNRNLKNPFYFNFSNSFQYEINLSETNISDITTIISSGNISHLYLSNNYIKGWTSEFAFFTEKYHIHGVNLSNNNILSINNEMGKTLNIFDSVDLGGNPFDCSLCSLKEFQNWLKNNLTKVLNRGTNNLLICASPLVQRGVTIPSAIYNSEFCKLPNYLLPIALPVISVIFVIIIIITVIYVNRFELIHIRHMWRMKKRSELGDRTEGCEFDVFVSYSSEDRPWVFDVLVPALEEPSEAALKYRLCLHERDFPAGSYIVENIVSCIERSRRVLLVLSPSFVRSQWCQWELRLAQQRIFDQTGRDFLILLELERLSRDALPVNLRVLMVSRTYLEWPARVAEERATPAFWERLRAALGEPLGELLEEPLQEEELGEFQGEPPQGEVIELQCVGDENRLCE